LGGQFATLGAKQEAKNAKKLGPRFLGPNSYRKVGLKQVEYLIWFIVVDFLLLHYLCRQMAACNTWNSKLRCTRVQYSSLVLPS
jgi:hypothetical protein